MTVQDYSNKLVEKGLKVTPQRIAILEAILKLNNHPTAENIIEYIRKNHPNISTATVYKVLDALIASGLVNRVTTDRDIMRYDAFVESHHHLYCSDSNRIEDYVDEELNRILADYFNKKGIPDFRIEDIRLQIIGRFNENKNTDPGT